MNVLCFARINCVEKHIFLSSGIGNIYKTARFPFIPIVCWIMTIDTSVFQ